MNRGPYETSLNEKGKTIVNEIPDPMEKMHCLMLVIFIFE